MVEGARSFWEARPWVGALVFATLVIVVGIILAVTVGERPHYRAPWRFVTERAPDGRVVSGPFSEDPVHIAVVVRVVTPEEYGHVGVEAHLRKRESGEVLSRGHTGAPSGRVHLPVPGRFDQDLFAGALEVAVSIPNAPPPEAVPTPSRGVAAVRFELPPLHSIVVRTADIETGSVRLLDEHGHVDPHTAGWPIRRGIAWCGGVPAGDVRLLIDVPDREARVISVEADQKQQRLRDVTTSPGRPLGTIRGRWIPLDGDPTDMPLSWVLCLRRSDRTVTLSGRATTGTNGAFAMQVPAGEEVTLEILGGTDRQIGVWRRTDRISHEVPWELGDVTPGPTPTLARGKVIGPDDTPMSDVTVGVEYVDVSSERPIVAGPVATTDSSGLFHIRGPLPRGRMRLAASAGKLAVRSDTPLEAGREDLVLRLAPGGVVEGSLEELPGDAVLIALVAPEAPDAAHLRVTQTRVRTFSFERVPAGTYDVVLLGPNGKSRRITGIAVKEGARTAPPTLQHLVFP